jgi:hypothetical protein
MQIWRIAEAAHDLRRLGALTHATISAVALPSALNA